MKPYTLVDWEYKLHSLANAIRDDPGNTEKYESQIKSILPKWVNLLGITIFQANQEQLPLPESCFHYPVRPMLSKTITGYDQTGDYVFFIDGHVVPDVCKWGGFIVERKSILDLYGTLYNYDKNGEKNRLRLYREIERSYALKWCDSFIIMVEGTEDDFYNLIPPRRNCKYCQFFKPDKENEKDWGLCFVNSTIDMTDPLGDCRGFIDAESDEARVSSMLNSKKATIAGLDARKGVQVMWCGSRERMAEKINNMIRLWCMQNWRRILGLDVPGVENDKKI